MNACESESNATYAHDHGRVVAMEKESPIWVSPITHVRRPNTAPSSFQSKKLNSNVDSPIVSKLALDTTIQSFITERVSEQQKLQM